MQAQTEKLDVKTCFNVKIVDVATLSKYVEAVPIRVTKEDERLAESIARDGLITPIVVSADGKIIEGYRVAKAYVKLYNQGKVPGKIPIIVNECADRPDVARFLSHWHQETIRPIGECQNVVFTMSVNPNFDFLSECPLCRSAFILKQSNVNHPTVDTAYNTCIKLALALANIAPSSIAISNLEKILELTRDERVKNALDMLNSGKNVLDELEIPSPTPTTEEVEEEEKEEKRDEIDVYISKRRSKVERRMKSMTEEYKMLIESGVDKKLAKTLLVIFDRDEIRDFISYARRLSDSVGRDEVNKTFMSIVRSYMYGYKNVKITKQSTAKLEELSKSFGVPMPIVLNEIIDIIYSAHKKKGFISLEDIRSTVF